ncbi:MAG TPA: phage holin family protein [Aggregatilineaceae bacterium]|nr:phage holin family protein [Aggregatilineaceae bacterium]
MTQFVLRLVVNAIALVITAYVLPGISVANEVLPVLLVALIFGVVNALVKPVIMILSCPLIIVTLGLFYLVVNGLMLLITDALAGDRFEVDGLGWAILGGIVMGLVGMALEGALGLNEKKTTTA